MFVNQNNVIYFKNTLVLFTLIPEKTEPFKIIKGISDFLFHGSLRSEKFRGYHAENEDTEGLLISPSGGIWFNISERFALFSGMTCEIQKLRYANKSDNIPFRKSGGSISLSIGLAF